MYGFKCTYVLIGGGLRRVWCVKRVLVYWNSFNYHDWKEGEKRKYTII